MAEVDKIKELERQLKEEREKNKFYEGNGASKLFYALNRKAAEMAERLNRTDLVTIVLDDPKDKTFDRIKVIWNDAASIAVAIKSLGETAGITNDENADTQKAVYKRVTTPENMADSVGGHAGMNK